MRRAALVVILAACGPKVAIEPSPYDEDDPAAGAPVQRSTFRGWDERVEAPHQGEGLRTGTIDRTALLAVLDAGPGQFLRQLEVTGAMDGELFVGWQLVQLLDKSSALHRLDLVAGDILIALNGAPLSRPDQLMTVWDSLRSADRLTCDLLRGEARFQISFAIEPPAGRVSPDLAAPTAAPPAPAPAPTPKPAPPPPTTIPSKTGK
jgi:hypothetical protein